MAQAAAPSLKTVENEGLQSLNQELPWRELFQRNQSPEWFDTDAQLLAREGNRFSTLPLNKASQVIQQQGQMRTLTIAVYSNSLDQRTLQLKGYIRASESTERMDAMVRRLVWGLAIGKTMAVILSGLGGIWLTQQALEPVEQSFQRLKQFTPDASHELRNPLTAISIATEVLQSHPERIHPSDARKLVAIASATNQLTRLAEDLLFLARTDAAVTQPRLERTSVFLGEVLADLLEFLEPQAQAQNITISSQLLTGISVKGEATQLRRLFSNLLENALKYTQAGGSVVLSMNKHQQFVVVRVEDTGIGIAAENLPFIF